MDDQKRALGAEERALEPEKNAVKHDDAPEVEGHGFRAGPEGLRADKLGAEGARKVS